jgi:BRCA1-A complex subunit BRE
VVVFSLPLGEVVFDCTHPGFPPDIIFSSSDEFMEFEPNIDQLEVFSEWSLRSPGCLSQLLEGLLVQYREHHKALLSQSHRLHFELQSLLQSGLYSEVDVHCSRPEENVSEPLARFYIPLPVDFSTIPAYLTKCNPGPDSAALLVTFHPPNASKVTPHLFLSPRVERVLGGTGSLRLPPWGGGHETCLMDYVPLIHQLLTEKVEAIIQSYTRRKEYVAALLSIMGRSVLEYDTEGFKKVAFLFEQQGFSFVAHLELTDDFPKEQPSVVLSSVYHCMDGFPCQSIVSDYPYSPRWSTEEMAERFRNYLIQTAPKFKDLSKEKGEFL